MKRENAITITATGTTVTTGAASSAAIAVPTTSENTKPNYVRISATVESYIRFGTSGVPAATTNDILIQPADSMVLALAGCTHFRHIQGTTTGKINILPLEDF